MTIFTVEINPDLIPIFLNNSYNNVDTVVFPFVPVTPIRLSFEDGLP